MRKTETITTITCDLCGNEIRKDEYITVKYPVIFTTEQNEGRCCQPYIDYENLDLCINCQKKVLKVCGDGAQGNNRYEFMIERYNDFIDQLDRCKSNRSIK